METSRFLTFYQSFDRILKDIKKKEMSYMRDYGLRSVHFWCLLRMYKLSVGMTVTELARATKTDKALVSRILKELTADGFVDTIDNGEEKTYNKKYCLTEKSNNILADIDKDIAEYMGAARKGISEEKMQEFYKVLASLENNISLIANNSDDEQ